MDTIDCEEDIEDGIIDDEDEDDDENEADVFTDPPLRKSTDSTSREDRTGYKTSPRKPSEQAGFMDEFHSA